MRMNAGGTAAALAVGRVGAAASTAARQPKPISAWTTARWVDTAPFGRPVVPDV